MRLKEISELNGIAQILGEVITKLVARDILWLIQLNYWLIMKARRCLSSAGRVYYFISKVNRAY